MADDLAATDPVCRTVLHLRQPGVLEARIRRAWREAGVQSMGVSEARILQTHYKPYDRARVLVSAVVEEDKEFSAPTSQYFFLQVYPTVDQAARRFEKGSQKAARRCYGPPLIILDDWAAVVWALPNGPKLGPVGIFFDPRKFARFLSRFALTPRERSSGIPLPLPRLVRYVPRKRALFRLEIPHSEAEPLYFKIYAPGQDEKPANHLTRLTRAADGGMLNFRVPRILAHSPAKRTVVMEGLPGVCLTERMKTAEDPAVFALVGGALAGFHRSGIRAADLWAPEKELSSLHTAMSEVRVALPPLASCLDEVLDRTAWKRRNGKFTGRNVWRCLRRGASLLSNPKRRARRLRSGCPPRSGVPGESGTFSGK